METRSKYYATIVYPESATATENWIEQLEEQHIPALVSPLHNQDIDKDGEFKKPHYHVLMLFESLKSKKQAKTLFEQIGGVGCETIQAVRSYARYLCHIDSDDVKKPKYDTAEVQELSGADYLALIKEQENKYEVIGSIIDHAKRHRIRSYAELVEYGREHDQRMYMALIDYPYPVMAYLKSKAWTMEQWRKEEREDEKFLVAKNL